MTKIKDGGPAFPHTGEGTVSRRAGMNISGPVHYPGMTMRDYFAAHCPPMPDQWFKDSAKKRNDPLWHFGEASAAWAYFYADAMMAAREEDFR